MTSNVSSKRNILSLALSVCWAPFFAGQLHAASPASHAVMSTAGPGTVIPELDLSPQDELIVSNQDTANWVLSYPAVLPLIPPANAPWAGDAQESVARGALAETIFLLESVPTGRQDVDWHVYRANLLLRIGMLEDAEAGLRTALKLSPDHLQALALASVVASARGRKDDALNLAQRATRLDPNSGAAWLALSYTQQAQGQLEAALASTRLAQASGPGNATGWIREAELHLAEGRLGAAQDSADRALAIQPDSSIAHSTRALLALLRGDGVSARSGFEHAVRLNPVDANARFGLGLAHIQQGNWHRARDEFEIAVNRAPNNSLFLSYLGRTHLAMGEDETAQALFERAKKADPNNPIPWLFSSLKHLQENRPASALDDIQASARRNEARKVYRGQTLLSDDRVSNQIDLTNALLALGFPELSLRAAQEAVEFGGTNSAAYRNLADAYGQVGRGTQARRSLALQSLFDAPLGHLPMALDVAQGIGSASNVPTHSLPGGLGPRQVGLNEYAALFDPAGWRLALDGNLGGHGTWGEQVRLGGRLGEIGIGFAQFSQKSDGIDGKLLDNDTWQGVLQARISPKASAFLEYRHVSSLREEILFPYDPLPFLVIPLDADEKARIGRLGLNWRLNEHATLKLLLSRQWRDQKFDYTDAGFSALLTGTADMPEIQYQGTWDDFVLTLGASRFDETGKTVYSFDPPGVSSQSDLTAPLFYGYGTWRPNTELTLTLGLSHVDFSQDGNSIAYDRTMPKFGLSWKPTASSQFRFTALEAVALPKTGGSGLEPVTVAGMQQWFGDEIGVVHKRVGMSWEQALTPSLSLIIEASHDRLLVPGFFGSTLLDPQYERQAKAGLYWRLPDSWLASWEGGLHLTVDRLDQERPNMTTDNNNVKRQIARHWTLGGQFSGPRGLGLNLGLTRVDANQSFLTSTPFSDNQGFWMADLAMTWNFDRNRKRLSLGVRNATDQDIGRYQEADTLMPRFAANRYFYGRLQWQFD